MTINRIQLLKGVELFSGLTEAQLQCLIDISKPITLKQDEIVFAQGDEEHIGDKMRFDAMMFAELFMQQLRETGRPVVLTINGKAELVVQEAQSYQKLLDLIDRLETIEGVKRYMQDEHPDRLLDRMQRVGGRGFEAISWDAAMQRVIGEIKRIQ